jgi:hypothetical protein
MRAGQDPERSPDYRSEPREKTTQEHSEPPQYRTPWMSSEPEMNSKPSSPCEPYAKVSHVTERAVLVSIPLKQASQAIRETQKISASHTDREIQK